MKLSLHVFLTCIQSIVLFFNLSAQTPTVGIVYESSVAFDGYTLFTPEKNTNVYLVDNCGQLVNEWTFLEQPGATCYLLENGNLLRAGSQSLEIRAWDNSLIWSYAMNANGYGQHHDIEPLPNGNILCILGDSYSEMEAVEAGRIPGTTDGNFRLDQVIELEPLGTNAANLVWEWKFMDHLVQDFDNSKANFGVIADHPELIDVNFNNGFNSDYTHVNAIDYNAELDQIIVSARNLSEIYVIDHSTTIIEAAGGTGGNFGLGGDILWRWGNPQVYDQGDFSDQKIFMQHDARWVEPGYLDEGKISVFNNEGDGSGDYSAVHLIEPEIVNSSYTITGGKFNPIDFDWSWDGNILGTVVVEGKKSGAHGLPNGNFIICETSKGRISEISKTGELLWSYVNPSGFSISPQYAIPSLFNTLFRGEKYPANYAGLVGQDLSPIATIENENPLSDICLAALDVAEIGISWPEVINPVRNNIIEYSKDIPVDLIELCDLQGRVIFKTESKKDIELKPIIDSGTYFLNFRKGERHHSVQLIVP